MEKVTLAALCGTTKKTVNPQASAGETFLYFSIPDFDGGQTPSLCRGRDIQSNKLLLEGPCLLFSRLNPRIKRVWDIEAQLNGYRAIASTEWVPFIIKDPSLVDKRYLYWFLASDVFTSFARAGVEAATKSRERVDKDRLFEFRMPLPPLPEQKRIAAILDKADALRRKRREAMAKLDTLLRSVFLEMFGDPSANPKRWPVATLADIISDGPQNGIYKPASAYGSGVPILRIDSFDNGSITRVDRLKRVRVSEAEALGYRLNPNDIVINRVNSLSHLGKSALIPELSEPTVFESNMMRFAIDRSRANPRYLVRLLQDWHIKAQILTCAKDAVNQSSINQQDVRSLKVVLPPTSEQRAFERFARSLDSQAARLACSLEHLQTLFVALQGQAFRNGLTAREGHLKPQLCLTFPS